MLKGKTAIITGGAMGIGGAAARKFAEYGAKVVIADFNEEEAKKNAVWIREAGGDAIVVKADVTEFSACEAAVAKCVDHYGSLDILAHCAGISTACKIIDMTDAIWDRTMTVNLKGTLNMDRACLKIMQKNKRGRIVNVASISGKTPEDMNGAYCASKAAVMMLTQVIALEHAADGITANAVCPGPTNTAIMQKVFRERSAIEGITPAEFEEKFLSDIPLHRMAEPDDIGELICFLASDRASYITGQCFTISGGKIWI
jgi:NAD(P)-dependent dehydrogenase (short-subunit alcohol dehydrogenase family)